MSIFKALAAAQSKFEAARKSSDNGHFKSKYADLSACMDAVRAPCNEHGIFVTQTIESVESGILVETVFIHESGEQYAGGKLFMPVTKHDAHGYGSALTYARRYSLLAATGVAPEDDDGNGAAAHKPEKIVGFKRPANYDPKAHMPATKNIESFLPDESRQVCKEWAAEAADICTNVGPEDALDFLASKNAEGDERLYIMNLLPHEVATAIKKVSKQQKAA